MKKNSGGKFSMNPALVSLLYAAVSELWIVFSDRLVERIASNSDVLTRLSMIKGSLFVFSSAALIYYLMSRISSANRTLSERVQAGIAELRKSEGRYRRVLETAQEGVWVVDRNDRTEFVNQRLTSMLNFSMEEMLGKNPLDYLDPASQSMSPAALSGQQSFSSLELRFRRHDGSALWALVSRGLLFDDAGRYDGAILLVSDITEQRRAEDNLRLQAAAVNSAANGIVVTDSTGTILWVNPAFTAMTGYASQDVVGHNPRILKSGHHDSAFYTDLWNTIRSGRVWRGEMVNRQKSGDLYCEEMTVAPVRSRDGEITHFVAIKQDVTARNQAREALRRNEERFRRLVENISDGIVAADAQGRIQYASESACRVTGYPRQQLVGRDLFQFVQPEDVPQIRSLFARVVQEPGSTRQWGARIKHKDGSWRYLEGSTANLLQDPDIAALIINFRDSTARRETEEALIRAEARYRAIFENATVGIYLSAPDGHYLSMNQTLACVYGFPSPVEAIQSGGDIKRFYVDARKWEEFRQILARDGAVRDFEYEVHRRDGTQRWLLESARAVYDEKGKLLYYEGVAEDVTERKILELQLRQAQKLEAVGRLAGGVAHDFNNMLGVILGYGDILQSQLPPDHPGLDSAAEMQKAARRAADLTRQLLAFSRKQILQPQVVSLNSLISDLNKMLRRLIGEHIELEFRPGEPVSSVKADPGQLEQVVMNLAVNARDAMPGGGRLSIETRNVSVDKEFAQRHSPMLPGDYVLLSIADTGTGMDSDTLSHIFEPFFTTKEQGKGTGLGLSIVYGVVKQSGGYIWVDSEPGHGTTFRIYLPPTSEVQPHLKSTEARQTSAGGTETILVVEDESRLREMIRVVLGGAGYKVLDARTGDEALLLVENLRQPLHLLIADIILPGKVSGSDLAQSMVAAHPEVRTLFMTGFGVELDSFGIEVAPDVMLLPKPFNADQLLRKVRETLDRNNGVRSATAR